MTRFSQLWPRGANTIIVTRIKTAVRITVIFLLFLESGSALTLGQDNYPKCVQSTVYVLKIAANKGDNLKLIEKP